MQDRPRPRRRTVIAAALAALLAGGGGAYWALDRFVIDHVEIADAAAYEAAHGGAAAVRTTTGTVSGSPYTSDDATVTVSKATTGSGQSTVTYFVADVVLGDATRLRSAFAQDKFGTDIVEDTSVAAANDTVFAINGDYYGFRDTGIVVRDEVAYRDAGARTGLAFYRDGTVRVRDETTTTGAALRRSSSTGQWSTASTRSRSARTSATTRSRATSRAPPSAWSAPTISRSWSSTAAAPATARGSRCPRSPVSCGASEPLRRTTWTVADRPQCTSTELS
jgi:hypothetical protein